MELVAEGEWFVVECAVRKDGSSPVSSFLDGLGAAGIDEADAEGMSADEQVAAADWFVEACEQIAESGRPPHGRSFNQLMNGIWELKRQAVRVTFYDTDGHGHHDPVIDRSSPGPYEDREWPDDFAEILRLTTGFIKKSQKVPQREIRFAAQVRNEDLSHDR